MAYALGLTALEAEAKRRWDDLRAMPLAWIDIDPQVRMRKMQSVLDDALRAAPKGRSLRDRGHAGLAGGHLCPARQEQHAEMNAATKPQASACVRERGGGPCRLAMAGNHKCTSGPGRSCVETSTEEAIERCVAAALAAHRCRKQPWGLPEIAIRPAWHTEAIRLFDAGSHTQRALAALFGKARGSVSYALCRSLVARGRQVTSSARRLHRSREYARKCAAAAREASANV